MSSQRWRLLTAKKVAVQVVEQLNIKPTLDVFGERVHLSIECNSTIRGCDVCRLCKTERTHWELSEALQLFL